MPYIFDVLFKFVRNVATLELVDWHFGLNFSLYTQELLPSNCAVSYSLLFVAHGAKKCLLSFSCLSSLLMLCGVIYFLYNLTLLWLQADRIIYIHLWSNWIFKMVILHWNSHKICTLCVMSLPHPVTLFQAANSISCLAVVLTIWMETEMDWSSLSLSSSYCVPAVQIACSPFQIVIFFITKPCCFGSKFSNLRCRYISYYNNVVMNLHVICFHIVAMSLCTVTSQC